MTKWTYSYSDGITIRGLRRASFQDMAREHNADIDALEAEIAELRGYRNRWEASEATINEAIRLRDRAYGDRDHWRALFAAANATLDALREVVPEGASGMLWCHNCKKLVTYHVERWREDSDLHCDKCNGYATDPSLEFVVSILYPATPKETDDDNE